MTSSELRKKFLEFFEERGHKVIPSASLVPENDPSVLFTTAGMHPLVPYLLGEKHPLGKRLCNVQKCLRTDDIDEVGDAQHCTFFEMLGYWSLGDYFKRQSIHYTFDFYNEVLGFSKDDIFVTVFAGDETAPFDQESFDTWKDEIGIPEERICKYGRKENWWGPVGATGPCGPCTEMFIDTGLEKCSENCGPSCHCDKFIEIGNNVFMEFNKISDTEYEPLTQKNVDVGLGFERLLMFSQKKDDVFETDLFWPIMQKVEKLSGMEYGEKTDEEYIKANMQCWVDVRKQMRIVVDHMRAASFAIADGAIPSNKGAGYIVRRLIRRAIVQANNIGIKTAFTSDIADSLAAIYQPINQKLDEIKLVLVEEEEKFRDTLTRGLKKLEVIKGMKIGTQWEHGKIEWQDVKLFADELFDLYQKDGIPFEVAIEEAKKMGIPIAERAFETAEVMLKIEEEIALQKGKHQNLSRTASAGMFKGGLADNKVETLQLHTAAHLLLAALRQVLSSEVSQKGSNITEERLRFDFNWPEKMSPEQIVEVENIVNEKIKEDIPIQMEELSLEDAKKSGASGVFDDRYGEKVKVYTIGDSSTSSESPFSREICGGPHVKSTSELGTFKIIKEESSSAGVRRIKAILE